MTAKTHQNPSTIKILRNCVMSNKSHQRVASNHNSIVFVLWFSVRIALVHLEQFLWMCSPALGVSFGLLGLTVSVVGGRCPLFCCNAVPCSPLRQASGASFSATFQQLCFCAWLVRFLMCTTRAVICRTHGAANVNDFPGIDADTRRAFVRLLPFHSERTFVRCFPTSLPDGGREHRKRLRVFV